jgi:hypothetical protein
MAEECQMLRKLQQEGKVVDIIITPTRIIVVVIAKR